MAFDYQFFTSVLQSERQHLRDFFIEQGYTTTALNYPWFVVDLSAKYISSNSSIRDDLGKIVTCDYFLELLKRKPWQVNTLGLHSVKTAIVAELEKTTGVALKFDVSQSSEEYKYLMYEPIQHKMSHHKLSGSKIPTLNLDNAFEQIRTYALAAELVKINDGTTADVCADSATISGVKIPIAKLEEIVNLSKKLKK